MSIASEISRLSSNISDSLDAVAAKGVTVPSDSNSDDLPGLIALIEQSSGGDSGGTIYQDLDGYLHLSEDDKNVISIVDTLDTAGGTIRTITSKVDTGGSGSSPIQLLGTVTVPSDIRAVNIDTTPYNSYDFYFCIIDATLTASDWLYLLKNGSSATGGSYQNSSINHHGLIFSVAKEYSGSRVFTYLCAGTNIASSQNAPDNVYVYTYVETKLIKAGSTFKIYGGNYADM